MRVRSGLAGGLLVGIFLVFTSGAFAGISFNGVRAFKAGDAPQSVATGDFNGDGKADLAVVNGYDSNVSVLLGSGDGTFPTQKRYPAGVGPSFVITGDFNKDGKTDLAIANSGGYDSRGDTISVLLGNGDGTFQPKKAYAVNWNPTSVATGDFNKDGKTDLAVSNSGTNDSPDRTVSILFGNGDGTFQAQKIYVVGDRPSSVAVGDFNGDGKADLAIANSGYLITIGNISVLLGNGDGTFGTQQTYTVGPRPRSVAIGDFNGDGKADLAVVVSLGSSRNPKVSLLFGNGDGTFHWGAQKSYVVGDAPAFVTIGNFNGDEKADLAVVNSLSNNVSVLIGNGDGTFQANKTYISGYAPTSVAIGDFNGDGKTDLGVANSLSNNISVLIGNGDGTFQTQTTYVVGWGPISEAIGDFNGDGKADLAVVNRASFNVSVLIGNGDGSFKAQKTYDVRVSPTSVAIGDFNGDGKADLVLTNYYDNNVSVLLGNGNGTFQTQNTYAVNNGPQSVVTGDFDGDGKADLAVANSLSNDVSVLLGNGDGTFHWGAQKTYSVGDEPSSVAIGDFNGDGKTDLGVANSLSNDVSVLLGNGDGTFHWGAQKTYSVGDEPSSVAIGDFNGDGKSDLTVANNGGYDSPGNTISVRLGNGDGTFQAHQEYTVGSLPTSVAIGDFNGDGKADLAIGGSSVMVLRGKGDGTFAAGSSLYSAGFSHSLAAGDFNGDGKADLAASNSTGNVVSILINTTMPYSASISESSEGPE